MSIEEIKGSIPETKIGNLKIGGKSSYYSFDGGIKNSPILALMIEDEPICDLPDYGYADVYNNSDISAWIKSVKDLYSADAICIRLNSIDPYGTNASKEEAKNTIEKAIKALNDTPLIIWGCNNKEKNTEVFSYLMKEINYYPLIIGPIECDNYKELANSAKTYSHKLIANSPIDINMAKQFNILLENEGLPLENILIDPTVSAIGYGIEYSYSIIERIRIASLSQNDKSLQVPIICNIARDTWKIKENSALNLETWGDDKKRGAMWEAMTATSFITAGADIVIMLNPESIRLVNKIIKEIY